MTRFLSLPSKKTAQIPAADFSYCAPDNSQAHTLHSLSPQRCLHTPADLYIVCRILLYHVRLLRKSASSQHVCVLYFRTIHSVQSITSQTAAPLDSLSTCFYSWKHSKRQIMDSSLLPVCLPSIMPLSGVRYCGSCAACNAGPICIGLILQQTFLSWI